NASHTRCREWIQGRAEQLKPTVAYIKYSSVRQQTDVRDSDRWNRCGINEVGNRIERYRFRHRLRMYGIAGVLRPGNQYPSVGKESCRASRADPYLCVLACRWIVNKHLLPDAVQPQSGDCD